MGPWSPLKMTWDCCSQANPHWAFLFSLSLQQTMKVSVAYLLPKPRTGDDTSGGHRIHADLKALWQGTVASACNLNTLGGRGGWIT
uniref:Uncharacterized protein n=1 Tax=Rhinopithecus roxellana TaxID=61622 RepID=A0A2K6PB08_RHIRO